MEENKKNKIPNVPNLRFSDDTWKIAKIGDVLTIERGGSPRPIQNFVTRRPDGINWIKIGDTSDDGYIYSAKEKIIPEGVKHSRKVKAGDLLLSNSMSFGKPYILKINGCIHDGWLVIRDMDNKFSKEFLRNYLGSSFCISQYKKLAAGGVVTNLNKDLVCSAIIKYPPMTSQEKIASFLCALDERIRTQNKIIEKYESLIKQLNDDIFSRGDNSKISDFIQELSKRNKDGAVTNVLSVSNKNGFVKQSEQFEDKELASEDKTNYKIVQKGDFAFNPARINVGSIALLKNQEIGIVSPMYICFKAKNIPSEILESYFSSSSFKKEMNKRLEGSVRMCLTIDGMKNIRFHNPSKKEIDILSRLTKLKELVVISKRILDLYNSQKSYLLSNLFI